MEAEMADLARQAEHTLPWWWYCRICGAKGEAADPESQRSRAMAHLEDRSHPRPPILAVTQFGRVLRVWSY